MNRNWFEQAPNSFWRSNITLDAAARPLRNCNNLAKSLPDCQTTIDLNNDNHMLRFTYDYSVVIKCCQFKYHMIIIWSSYVNYHKIIIWIEYRLIIIYDTFNYNSFFFKFEQKYFQSYNSTWRKLFRVKLKQFFFIRKIYSFYILYFPCIAFMSMYDFK